MIITIMEKKVKSFIRLLWIIYHLFVFLRLSQPSSLVDYTLVNLLSEERVDHEYNMHFGCVKFMSGICHN